jgi:hypothetical protein
MAAYASLATFSQTGAGWRVVGFNMSDLLAECGFQTQPLNLADTYGATAVTSKTTGQMLPSLNL